MIINFGETSGEKGHVFSADGSVSNTIAVEPGVKIPQKTKILIQKFSASEKYFPRTLKP